MILHAKSTIAYKSRLTENINNISEPYFDEKKRFAMKVSEDFKN